jgi:predicted dehydrogenase
MGLTGADAEPCAVAVVGAGRMSREHIRAFASVPGVTVAGIHSRSRPRAEALASELGVPLVADSVPELYEKTRARLVVVTVFETAMRDVALACFEQPWTVLLEKPPGLSVDEAVAIRDRAGRLGRDVRVGLNRQYLSSTQHVLNGLSERPGPRFVKVQDQQSLATAKAIGHPPEVVRGWMYANSIHLVDYFRLFARGRPVAVEAVVPWRSDEPSVVVTRIGFDSGDLGLYEAIWHGPGPWAATVTVPGHRWELRPLEQCTAQPLGEPATTVPLHEWDKEWKPGFRLQAERAVAAALGLASDVPSLDEALRTMRLISALYPQ